MTMTRKHFKMIAACNREALSNTGLSNSCVAALHSLITAQAAAFSTSNTRFDTDRFIDASLPVSPTEGMDQ